MANPQRTSLLHPIDRRQRLRTALRMASRTLRLPRWFPHMPLALALAVGGATSLLAGTHADLHIFGGLDFVDASVRSLAQGSPAVPSLLLGVGMLAMSVGLVLRSRFSWVVSLLLTAATLVVALKLRHATGVLAYYDGLLLVALLVAGRTFDRSSATAGTLFALTSSLMLLTYAVFGTYYLGDQFSPPVKDLTTALYYSMVTMSTVGYGDISPHTPHAKLFAVSMIILGITVFAASASAIAGPIIGGSLKRIINRKERTMNRKGHYVIVGQSALAKNTYQSLRARNHPVTVIFAQAPTQHDFDPEDVVVGDPTSLEVLREAGADEALAVLAMRDDDSENAFIVLAVKELECKAKTVAAVNDGAHITRIKRVHPDIILAPQVLGGELLAMALSGEAIDGNFVMDRFLHFDA